jgi:hypothetical protein
MKSTQQKPLQNMLYDLLILYLSSYATLMNNIFRAVMTVKIW